MAGFPQLREHGWLYAAGSTVPLAHVRLLEHPDGAGWDIYLSDPAPERPRHVHWDDEGDARGELACVYAAGRVDGRWRIWRDAVEVDDEA